MRLERNRAELLAECQTVAAAAATRDTKPVLRDIKYADGVLMATDLEQGILLPWGGDAVRGAAILPAARLIAILKASAAETVTIDVEGTTVKVQAGGAKFEMPTMEPELFPDIPTQAGGLTFSINPDEMREAIRRTVFAAAKENNRYSMAGVLFDVGLDTLRMVGTDSKRLAVAAVIVSGVTGEKPAGAAVVPTRALSLVERLLGDDAVVVTLGENDATFQTGKGTVYTRLVEGRYPPYKDILPKKSAVTIPLDAGETLAAVRQAAVMTDKETQRVRFTFGGERLALAATTTEGASQVEATVAYAGKPIETFLDPHYVTEFLRVIDPDAPLELDLTDGTRPVLFRCGRDYQYLVMPLTTA